MEVGSAFETSSEVARVFAVFKYEFFTFLTGEPVTRLEVTVLAGLLNALHAPVGALCVEGECC